MDTIFEVKDKSGREIHLSKENGLILQQNILICQTG